MALRKVGKYYWLDIRIKGKRIRRSLHTDNKFVALDRYKEKKDELLSEYAGKKVRFSDFCKQYIDWAWDSKPASALREEQRLKKIQEFFDDLDLKFLEDITPYHVEQLKAYLRKKIPVTENKKGLSKATVNRYLQILRGMFYRARDWGVYEGENPLRKIRFYHENSRPDVPTARQIEKIIQTSAEISKNPQSPLQKVFHDLVVFALNTGMRKSEILNLKWRDIKDDEILVEGKGEKRRNVPMNRIIHDLIKRQPHKTEYVFDVPNRHQKDCLRKSVDQIKKRTGINFHFHLLRHFFTTALLERGVDFITIGAILGHSRIMTSMIYSHTNKEKKKRAVDLLI